MTKQEFEQRLGWAVSENEYRNIETVYAFHPSISETSGKDQITYLYKTFGMRIIEDMLPTAKQAKVLGEQIIDSKIRLDVLLDEYKALSKK